MLVGWGRQGGSSGRKCWEKILHRCGPLFSFEETTGGMLIIVENIEIAIIFGFEGLCWENFPLKIATANKWALAYNRLNGQFSSCWKDAGLLVKVYIGDFLEQPLICSGEDNVRVCGDTGTRLVRDSEDQGLTSKKVDHISVGQGWNRLSRI